MPGNNLITEVCGTGNYEADLPEGYEFNVGDTYTATLDALSYELKVAGVEENKIIFSPVSDMTSLSEADYEAHAGKCHLCESLCRKGR